MTIVSFIFLLFLIFSLICYYLFPKKHKWIVLLLASIAFFLCACSWYLILYLFFGITITYIGTRLIDEKAKTRKQKKCIYLVTLIATVFPLFLIKYFNIIPMTINCFGSLFNLNLGFAEINLLGPLGISYYTLSLISYITDVYWTTCKPQKNYFKHALFTCYFPAMVSGPIIKYTEIKDELFNENKLDWNNIYQGFYRIVYGLMKKLVIADLLYQVVNQIFLEYQIYTGIFIIIGVVFYAIQIYCDFSGCMDIVIGASKMFGVKLPENFDSPLFSKNLSEFWRRWHISLGKWAKDYIMYPLLKTELFQDFGKKCKKVFGKKYGKKIPTVLAILILWLGIGLWHGTSYKYIVAAGVIPWIYLTISDFTEDFTSCLNKKLHIKTDCFSYRLFQSLRTIGLMCIVWLFVCVKHLYQVPSLILSIFKFPDLSLVLSINYLPYFVIFLMFALVILIDYLKYKGIDVAKKFSEQNLIFRWGCLFVIIAIILLYGSYGPAYNAVDFIYGGF